MNKNWFEDTIREWSPGVSWEKEELGTACELIAEISQSNGGETVKDIDIDQADKIAHAVGCAKGAIQRQVNLYAKAGNRHIPDRFFKNKVKFNGDKVLSFLSPKELLPRIDLNRATWGQLEGMPGIGKVTADRILDYREKVGPFKAVEDVQEIKGISRTDFEKFQWMVYIPPASEKPVLRFWLLNEFYQDPSIENYFQLKANKNDSIQDVIIEELENIRYEIVGRMYPPLKKLPATRTSTVKAEIEADSGLKDLEAKVLFTNASGRLIFDRQYAPFLNEFIGQCQSSLRIIMFFFRFEDEKAYPTDPLVEKILDAKNRGAEIKVILDVDEADDPYNSEQINSNIYNYFKSKGINVVLDDAETVTHSKVVIMDSRHLLVGSHNWTAGSFYQYDDTSVYVDSPDLAEDYERDFEERWDRLSI